MADMNLVISEQDILRKIDLNGLSRQGSEDQIRAILEKMGLDHARSVFVKNEIPNRFWSNNRHAFDEKEPDHPPIAVLPNKDEQIADLKAKLAALENNSGLEPKDETLHLPKKK